MRFNIVFNRTSKQRMLPMDYQYYISAWIYKVLKTADKQFADFLHSQGYGDSTNKLYKLFCFSRLNFGKPILWKEKKLFEISKKELSLNISFDVPEAATNFIKGLFSEQEFYLGDKFNGLDIKVSCINLLSEPEFSTTMNYKLITPWVISYKAENSKHAKYLTPDDELFNELSIKHIIEKFNATRDKQTSIEGIQFNVKSDYKRSGFVMKKGTPQETRVVGNLFSFELIAPVDVHQMIWHAGISEKSSSGFGWVESSY